MTLMVFRHRMLLSFLNDPFEFEAQSRLWKPAAEGELDD